MEQQQRNRHEHRSNITIMIINANHHTCTTLFSRKNERFFLTSKTKKENKE